MIVSMDEVIHFYNTETWRMVCSMADENTVAKGISAMPIFEYECKKCGGVSEFLVGMTVEKEKPHCLKCGSSRVKKIFSAHAAVRESTSSAPACESASSCPNAASCGCRM